MRISDWSSDVCSSDLLVEWQLRVASGELLPLQQDQLAIHGWSMEARLYAENPATGFLPSTGPLQRLRFPAGTRIDSGVEEGNDVPPYYDPMIATPVVHAPTLTAPAQALANAPDQAHRWPATLTTGSLARAPRPPPLDT